ncbi:DUF4174 domain-containing protein [Celeribacter arenosi]|uniref:DUF4174 domain-containing protein n=1 Tax=Celeribacter arenosi TaxID=792649 RepID=A0ABP7JT16_9RHOB
MKNILISAFCAILLANTGTAQDATPSVDDETGPEADGFVTQSGEDAALSDFLWINRVIVVFADSPLDPSFAEQIELLSERPDELIDRDVVVLVDTAPDAGSSVRTQLRPRGFALVIVDKDGRVMLRKPVPWDLREITRSIDKTPLRQQEIRDEKNSALDGT